MGPTNDELQAELFAVEAVLISLFRRLAADRPDLAPLFCRAFDEAETIMAGVANQHGFEDRLGTTTGALVIIDQMRSAVLRDRDRICRD